MGGGALTSLECVSPPFCHTYLTALCVAPPPFSTILLRMTAHLVMTVISPDRPGIVELLSGCVAAQAGNWLESRMSRLGGQFTGLVRVEITQDKVDALTQALNDLERSGLRIVTHSENTDTPVGEGLVAHLEIIGQDRPGILLQISRILAAHKVNVEELTSERINAPMDGTMLFQAKAAVLLPKSVFLPALRSDLERIAADLMVDVRLQPAS